MDMIQPLIDVIRMVTAGSTLCAIALLMKSHVKLGVTPGS
jgi:hypothetical protein